MPNDLFSTMEENSVSNEKASTGDKAIGGAVLVVSLAMIAYHLVYVHFMIQVQARHLTTYLGFSLLLIYLMASMESKNRLGKGILLCLALLSLLASGYVEILYPELKLRVWFNTPLDITVGVLLMVLSLEAARRSFGIMIPLISVLVVMYPFLGNKLPEPFYSTSYTLERTLSNLSLTFRTGLHDAALSASANYIFLFVVFGGILQAVGATRFFIELGKVIGAKFKGGPGMMAVVSSAGVGSITGSVVANMTITGAFTIPLMKQVGYRPEQAGAIEGAASNGGQILPPVMGITAFAMAGVTGIPYVTICAMAVIPALLYFFNTGVYVQLQALKEKISFAEEKVDVRELLLSAPVILIPFAIIVMLLAKGYSVMYVAFWAIVCIIVLSLIRKKTRPSLGDIVEGFKKGAFLGAQIGAMTATVGLMITTFTMSGLGLKLAGGVQTLSGGNFHLILIIIFAVCILMGMAGVSISAYLIVAMFAAPALMKTGIPFEQAHFFVLFPALFAFITPPIAFLAIIGAKLAGASYIKTAIETIKVAGIGLLLPFMFIYTPVLLLAPRSPMKATTGLIASILLIVAGQFSFVGYFLTSCNPLERLLWFAAMVLLFLFLPTSAFTLFWAGIILVVILTIFQIRKRKTMTTVQTALP
jgi:TRAP transporter 4TM/12TM fusion protein